MFDRKIFYRILRGSYKSFGLSPSAFVPLAIPFWSWSMQAGMFLDKIIYPEYKSIEVKKPVFILGHPRSGTTFFHRLLTQGDDFCKFKTWEILIPSLVARTLLGKFGAKSFDMIQDTFHDGNPIFAKNAHPTSAESVEEEELLYLVTLDTQFSAVLFPLGFDDEDFNELVFSDERDEKQRYQSVRFLKECFKRQIYSTKKEQIVAKMPYSTMRIKTMLKEFPDAKFVYLVRSPYQTISSHLSLHRSFFMTRWGLDKIPQDRLMRYYKRRYQHNVDLYTYFHNLQKNGELPENRVKVIHYDRFLSDLENAFEDLVQFTGIEVSPFLRQKIREQAEKQKDYKRGHENLNFEDFGLTKEQIVNDLGFIFDEYGFDKELNDEKPKGKLSVAS